MNRRNEPGMAIVEATIVFPIMFLVVFFMIFAGNSFMQKCRIEAVVEQAVLAGASSCADPMLTKARDTEIPKSADGWEVYPYRYFSSSGVGGISNKVADEIKSNVEKLGTGLFRGMEPQDFSVSAEYNPHFLCATLSVDVGYEVPIPIRMLGEKEPHKLTVRTHIEMPVSDSAELIRNIDMVEDYVERTGAPEKINELIESAREKGWFGG